MRGQENYFVREIFKGAKFGDFLRKLIFPTHCLEDISVFCNFYHLKIILILNSCNGRLVQLHIYKTNYISYHFFIVTIRSM